MSAENTLKQKNKKEIEDLKRRLYENKRKRLEIIDNYLIKIKKELDTRDLKNIPTPVLVRMFVYFAELAKKEYPQIELQYSEVENELDFYKTEKLIF